MHPKTIEAIYEDYQGRREGLLRGLIDGEPCRLARQCACLLPGHATTTPALPCLADCTDFFQQCDPSRDNLCLYGARTSGLSGEAGRAAMSHPQPQARESSGPAFPIDCARPADPRAGHPDGSWTVNTPVEEVPPELPEPVLGINFARDGQQRHKACLGGSHSVAAARAAALRRAALLPSRPPPRKLPTAGMDRKDWLSLCAVHSDAWLMSVLFFYAARYDDVGRCVRPPSCLPACLPPHACPPSCLPACSPIHRPLTCSRSPPSWSVFQG